MKRTILWVLAALIMLGAAFYQRQTGPTHPYRANLDVAGESVEVRLLRTAMTTGPGRIVLPDLTDSFEAELHYKRYPSNDATTVASFKKEGDEWAAYLPVQPTAGKMEYFITHSLDGKPDRIPNEGEETIVLRYRDPVPLGVLLPHVILMFLSILIGMRAGMSAVAGHSDMRKLVFITLIGMTLGGLVFGPFVQKFAFGEYWTGFPFGDDLTDSKTLIMWVAWLVAAVVIGVRTPIKVTYRRAVVVLAAIVMMVVYLIPHSMRGSELNYDRVDRGVDPTEAVGSGD